MWKDTSAFTRSERYRIVNDTMKGLAYRNRRDEPLIPGHDRMYAEELDLFEAWCTDLEQRLDDAAYGRFRPLAEAIIAFRSAVRQEA